MLVWVGFHHIWLEAKSIVCQENIRKFLARMIVKGFCRGEIEQSILYCTTKVTVAVNTPICLPACISNVYKCKLILCIAYSKQNNTVGLFVVKKRLILIELEPALRHVYHPEPPVREESSIFVQIPWQSFSNRLCRLEHEDSLVPTACAIIHYRFPR